MSDMKIKKHGKPWFKVQNTWDSMAKQASDSDADQATDSDAVQAASLTFPLGLLCRLGFDSKEHRGNFIVTDRRTGQKVTPKGMSPAELLEWAKSFAG